MTLMLFLVSLSNVLMYLVAPWVYETLGFTGISWIGFVTGLICFALLTAVQRKYAEKF
jgi:small neutral amino acid transporter SnatA (MarC family)